MIDGNLIGDPLPPEGRRAASFAPRHDAGEHLPPASNETISLACENAKLKSMLIANALRDDHKGLYFGRGELDATRHFAIGFAEDELRGTRVTITDMGS